MLIAQRFQRRGGFGGLGMETTGSNQIDDPAACWREMSAIAIFSISPSFSFRSGEARHRSSASTSRNLAKM
jgi:hypothetical protein